MKLVYAIQEIKTSMFLIKNCKNNTKNFLHRLIQKFSDKIWAMGEFYHIYTAVNIMQLMYDI